MLLIDLIDLSKKIAQVQLYYYYLFLQVMYVGSAQARAIIREYEFYYPKNHKKIKKKKSGLVVGEKKQDRIKFDVLLTSYEMVNLDTTSLKPIKWESMVTFYSSICALVFSNV